MSKAFITGGSLIISSFAVGTFAVGCSQFPSSDNNQFGILIFVCYLGITMLCLKGWLNLGARIRELAKFFLSGILLAPVLSIVILGCFVWHQEAGKAEAAKNAIEKEIKEKNGELSVLGQAIEARKNGKCDVYLECTLDVETIRALEGIVKDYKN